MEQGGPGWAARPSSFRGCSRSGRVGAGGALDSGPESGPLFGPGAGSPAIGPEDAVSSGHARAGRQTRDREMTMATHEVLFQPLTIKSVTIPNRFVSTSHQPGYAARGRVTERYLRYEAEKARGGVGLVQFAGATSVSIENCYYYGQLDATTDAVVPDLQRMADAIHRHGATCTAQLTHGGRRERYDIANWIPAFGASCRRELKHRAFPAVLEPRDLRRIADDFARARAAGSGRRSGRGGDLLHTDRHHRPVLVTAHQCPKRRVRREPRQPHAFRAPSP